MKAMILAAGLGQRMRPLTDTLPKPMLKVGGKPLLQYHLESLAAQQISDVIINLAYLGDKIRDFAGDGRQFGLKIAYSNEPEPLETAGALLHALPLLGDKPFILINGDIWSDYPLEKLCHHQLQKNQRAHLVLVENPSFHPLGDFAFDQDGIIIEHETQAKYTFSGMSLIDPKLILSYPEKRRKFPLVEVLRYGIQQQSITAELHKGCWSDVGTPERLYQLDAVLNR